MLCFGSHFTGAWSPLWLKKSCSLPPLPLVRFLGKVVTVTEIPMQTFSMCVEAVIVLHSSGASCCHCCYRIGAVVQQGSCLIEQWHSEITYAIKTKRIIYLALAEPRSFFCHRHSLYLLQASSYNWLLPPWTAVKACVHATLSTGQRASFIQPFWAVERCCCGLWLLRKVVNATVNCRRF